MKTRMALVATGALLSLAAPASGSTPEADGRGPFADVDGSIHELDVAALWKAGITSGCEEWLFCPDEEVTRGEVAAFLARGLELPHPEEHGFSDTTGNQFAAEIAAIAAADITEGCEPKRYCPGSELSRGQMASLVVRALELPPSEVDVFADDDGTVHERNIAALAAAGITHGCEEGRFCPHRTVTRAEMASFLARALDLEPPAKVPEIPSEIVEELDGAEWPTGPGAEGWRPLVEQYFEPGDVDRAIRVMACESRGDPNARNPWSGASGLFQHMPRYWPERAAAAGFAGASIFDPEANVAAAAYLLYDYPGGGWQHWVCH
ncbi:MAG TPA: S-layer homology domain-containing protein [Acidimicrobiia bacterium]|nr:S-layer homology domain-containing protein [Acidimicrobiia bacterium]